LDSWTELGCYLLWHGFTPHPRGKKAETGNLVLNFSGTWVSACCSSSGFSAAAGVEG
jgi:hypothetical protein